VTAYLLQNFPRRLATAERPVKKMRTSPAARRESAAILSRNANHFGLLGLVALIVAPEDLLSSVDDDGLHRRRATSMPMTVAIPLSDSSLLAFALEVAPAKN